MPKTKAASAQTTTKYYPLGGGLDVVTPALSVDPGFSLAMVNFEPWFNGGYRRIDGYERFDGHAKPSDAAYTGFNVSSVAGYVLGQVLTDATSGATGKIVGIDGLAIGVTMVTGVFANGDSLGGGVTITSAPSVGSAPTLADDAAWKLQARNYYRALISVVPGSGNVGGVWQRKGNIYAVRNNVGGTAGIMYLASPTGWTTAGLTMATYLYFSAGGGGGALALPVQGDTLTGNSSGATGTVQRVIVHNGTTSGNNAVGFITLTNVVGAFTNGEALKDGGTTRATAASNSAVFAFSPSGLYEFINYNFFALSATYRTYGCNSLDPAFEIDEFNIVHPILMPLNPLTGQPAQNNPILVEQHQGFLFLAMPGGQFMNSVAGTPMQFNSFLGAAAFGVGDEITGMKSIVGNVLVLTTQHSTRAMYGTAPNDPNTPWTLKLIGEKMGAKVYTAQKLDTVYSLNDLGISNFNRVLSFGDFAAVTVSQLIQPIIQALRSQVSCSTIVRSSNQYRLYFSDGSIVIMYVVVAGQGNAAYYSSASTKVQFGYAQYPVVVFRVYNTEDATGAEVSYFTSNDGFVYQDRIGIDFDGAVVNSYCRLVFNSVGSPAYRKYFRRVDLEINSPAQITLQFVHDLSYGSPDYGTGNSQFTTSNVPVISVFGGGGFWDNANWNQFTWDGQNISTARADLGGAGENVGFLMFNGSATTAPFVLQGLTLHYELRRLQR